ncbi:MAG: Ig-like domain-containing protein [Lachnobacterium sp.]|nr:Ig-like domain-containing protein [Lachnobacterium sp.]
MKKRLVIGMLTAIVSLSLVGCAPKQIKDSVTIEAGEELSLEAEDFFDSTDGITFDTTDVDTSKVGEYEVTATYKNKEYSITVSVKDTTAPEFELVQDSIVTNDVGSLDAESLIASVEDVSKTTAELKFDEEPKEDGDYTASVVVTDEYGNSAEKSIGVAVDTTAPVISGVKDETVSVEPTVDSLHYTAEDSRDGEVSVETSIEKTDDSEYTVTAVAKDEAGNEAKETATLTLVEEKKTTAKSQSTGKSNSASQSTSTSASSEATAETPAQEAPAEPEVQPGQLDGSSLVTEEGQLGYGETLYPDTLVCPSCGFSTTDKDAYHTHLVEEGYYNY